MKFIEARRWAETELLELESPQLEAEILLCHLKNWTRSDLYLSADEEMSEQIADRYRKIVLRRKNREPLQHITGVVDFLDHTFSVGPEALIPRPETEYLTELIIGELTSPDYILDVGTGSGVIAVSLALEFPDALVVGTDISIEALISHSRNNRIRLGADNLVLAGSDLLKAFRLNSRMFDAVAANLPYIPTRQIPTLEAEVRNGDPRIALDGGADGLDLISALLDSVPGILKNNGILALELDEEQIDPISELLDESPVWRDVRSLRDLTGRLRFILARAEH